ncbi:MAG: carboxypeptidase M32 [Bacteroidia bacterium]
MTNYESYKNQLRRLADVNFAAAVLSWDQETYMPPKGADHRASQLATLAGLAHAQATDKALGELLEKLNADESLDAVQRANVVYSLRGYKKTQKYSAEFVESLSRAISEAFQAWQTAKKENKFAHFAPHLEKIIALRREECEFVGYKEHPYDALLDEYEPGLTTADVEKLFDEVRAELVPFVKAIAARKQNSQEILQKNYAKDKQWEFGLYLLRIMGYDFEAGRQDISMHPFTINFGPNDVRVTTRVDEHDLADMVTGSVHEGGHALYEQGLPESEYGLPSGEAVSLGIHESQSRLWENNVGRSLEYWKAVLPELKKLFPEQTANTSAQTFFEAFNVVQPSLIRVNADELTYHFHIMIRFEAEKALIEGSLAVNDIPAFWNKRYNDYLGIDVPTDAEGCLQDVHWSHGSFGYFPTYSLGSFYAAQFYAAAEKAIPDLEQQIERGELLPLRAWLRENIHQYGKQYSARELCERISGQPLQFSYFMAYARKKYAHLYGA